MSHHDGHEHGESEQAEHGHNGHGHDHPTAEGHEGAAAIIPEDSLQDKLLMLVAGLSLVGLLYFGSLWAFSLTPPAHSQHPAEEHHE